MTIALHMQSVSASNAQKSWMELTLRGFGDLARGETVEAAGRWLEAADLPWDGASFDPLYAASRSNAGAAHLLAGHAWEAERCFSDAAEAWQRTLAGIEMMDVPVTGASSSFHFRLAANDPGFLTAVRRNRYRRLAEAALVITELNRALPGTQRVATAKATLSAILGGQSPEVRLLATLPGPDVNAIYAGKFTALQENRQPLAAALSQECAQLESAVALTVLLSPSLFDTVRLGEGEFVNATNSSSNDV